MYYNKSKAVVTEQTRNSNIELLRILLMFFIVFGHAVSQSDIPANIPYSNAIITYLFYFARPATLCFMILTGLYMDPSKKITAIYTKMYKIWLKFAIELIIICIFCIIRFGYDPIYLLYSIFPLSWRPLWYVACYIMFLAFVPLINAAYLQIREPLNRMMTGIAVGFMVFGLGTISPFLFGVNIDKYPTFYSELLVYIAAYVIVLFLKEWIERIPQWIWWIIVIGWFSAIITIQTLYFFSREANVIHCFNGIDKLKRAADFFNAHIETVPMLAFSIGIIMLWKNISFSSPVVNKISRCTISVYVVHQMPLLFPHLWDEIYKVNIFATKPSWMFFLYMCFVFISLYFISWIFDYIINIIINKINISFLSPSANNSDG